MMQVYKKRHDNVEKWEIKRKETMKQNKKVKKGRSKKEKWKKTKWRLKERPVG